MVFDGDLANFGLIAKFVGSPYSFAILNHLVVAAKCVSDENNDWRFLWYI